MKNRNDKDRLQDIIHAIEKIQRYTANLKFEEFESEELVQDAVFKNFEVIGEAAYKVSKKTKDQNKEIDWRKIESLRHKLVHDYYEINLSIVWNTKDKKLPELYAAINRLLPTL